MEVQSIKCNKIYKKVQNYTNTVPRPQWRNKSWGKLHYLPLSSDLPSNQQREINVCHFPGTDLNNILSYAQPSMSLPVMCAENLDIQILLKISSRWSMLCVWNVKLSFALDNDKDDGNFIIKELCKLLNMHTYTLTQTYTHKF